MVLEKVRTTMDKMKDADMCKCSKCYYDVCALVLNKIGAPHYVTTDYGALMKKASFLNTENLGILWVDIYKAIDLVHKNPRH